MSDFRLIWFNSHLNNIDQDDFRRFIDRLELIVYSLNISTDIDECIDLIISCDTTDKVLFILSEDLVESLIDLIDDINQLNGIFILSPSQLFDEEWTNKWCKVKGIFSNVDSICVSIEQIIEMNNISISFIPNDHFDLNEVDQSFIFINIIKQILLQTNSDEESIKDFVIDCQKIFVDNQTIVNKMNQFEEQFHLRSPLWSHTFLRSMINLSLQKQNINILMKMRFFITALHEQINKCYLRESHPPQHSFLVYRRQDLSNEQFNKLNQCKGGLISFNNFFFATEDRQMALTSIINHQSISVLFQINIDTRFQTTPYAHTSHFNDRQLIFSIQTVFHIEDINISPDNDQLWIINLTMTSNDHPILSHLNKSIHQLTQGHEGWNRLGQLFIKLELFNKAEQLYCNLIDQCSPNDEEKVKLIIQLGHIKQKQGDQNAAMNIYQNALDILDQCQSKSVATIIDIYNEIASTLFQLEQYLYALPVFVTIVTLQQSIFPKDHPSLANSHTKIGFISHKMNDNSIALKSYEKALQILTKIHPSNHPDLSHLHNLIGDVYNKTGDFSQAFSHYQKGLKIKHQSTDLHHSDDQITNAESNEYQSNRIPTDNDGESCEYSDKAIGYTHLALVHIEAGEFSKASFYSQMALDICHTRLPPDHPSLLIIFHHVGKLFYFMHEDSKAFQFYQKALDIEQNIPPEYHKDLAKLYTSIARLYLDTGEYLQALQSSKKALEIQEKILCSNDLDLVMTCSTIAMAYKHLGDHHAADPFLIRSRQILDAHPQQQ